METIMSHEQQETLVAEARRIVRGETMMIGTTQHVRACLLTLDNLQVMLDDVRRRLYAYRVICLDPIHEVALRDPDKAR